ncbi:LTA synthase family protein [Photobacterium sp. ZSDE20]|uniref:LTA synthase family protein n=1 Tax=Photobacterium pectinilyticum TaxID=2906793 RepID=A0ABT1N4U1_9GAMM|nr:LTA synthase family protein [Photobacterium sp. ZSDE20]MCQ1059567.1 LTA synthase family protein [Photobacterium sp. ZSDE20]MDD1825430.1 LTA synthase family protein [Photobacterium sp. ZSDE20]
MIDIVKKRLGLLFPLAITLFVCLFILMLSRIGLSVWHGDRVNEADGWTAILLNGLRVDISTLSYLLVLPSLLTCVLASNGKLGKGWLFILRIWIVFGLWLLVYMELATPSFILEYDVRPNRLFIEYLIYPKEVFGMLWSGYKPELFIGTLVSTATLYWGWKFTRHLVTGLTFPRWYWRPVLAALVVVLGVMGARSTFGHRPLNPAMVAFSTDPLVNDLVLNSSYSLAFAAKQMEAEDSAFKYYGKMDSNEIIELVREATGKGGQNFVSDSAPTMAYHAATYQGKPKNLVILLQESLGARYVGALGGLPLTPNLDGLMTEGWNFTRMYSTGTRSVRGIEAVVTGFSPTPARSVVKLGKSQTGFFTIADLLKSKGYHTQFIYGGESHFDNMKSFFLGNGFVDMQDFPTFKDPAFVGSWGASDEDLYQKAHEQFSHLNADNQPFFSLVFTSSNHSPFDYPDGRITPYNAPKQTRENAAKYSDYALGEFFKQAKSSSYWDNTIFVVVADHDSRAYGNQLVPIDHFHIPAVIVGEGIPSKQDPRLVSQIDLAPTLLSLIGINSVNPMIGHDMTKDIDESKLRAMMQFYKNFAWMDNNNDVVIFQPDKPAKGFHYDEETTELLARKVPEAMVKMAKANAQWGSLAYQNNFYHSPGGY